MSGTYHRNRQKCPEFFQKSAFTTMRFRPGDIPVGDPTEPGTPVEWEDNAVSNAFAWASHKFLPTWCQTPEHWTSRVTNYLFTDCPCCLVFRGITVGAVMVTPLWLMVCLAIWWSMS